MCTNQEKDDGQPPPCPWPTKKAAAADTTLTDIRHPGPNDVKFGRGGDTNYNLGNARFRHLASQYRNRYEVATTKGERQAIVDEIIDTWRKQDPPGRFIARIDPSNKEQSIWYDVGNERAYRKAIKVLGEGMAERKKKQKHIMDAARKNKKPAATSIKKTRSAPTAETRSSGSNALSNETNQIFSDIRQQERTSTLRVARLFPPSSSGHRSQSWPGIGNNQNNIPLLAHSTSDGFIMHANSSGEMQSVTPNQLPATSAMLDQQQPLPYSNTPGTIIHPATCNQLSEHQGATDAMSALSMVAHSSNNLFSHFSQSPVSSQETAEFCDLPVAANLTGVFDSSGDSGGDSKEEIGEQMQELEVWPLYFS